MRECQRAADQRRSTLIPAGRSPPNKSRACQRSAPARSEAVASTDGLVGRGVRSVPSESLHASTCHVADSRSFANSDGRANFRRLSARTQGSAPEFSVQEVMTLNQLEYLQDRLLAGDEGRYDNRSPNSVNSTMGAVMAFVNFCHRRGWITGVPYIQKLDADDAMRGRPISSSEFQRMLDAVPEVVGEDVALVVAVHAQGDLGIWLSNR